MTFGRNTRVKFLGGEVIFQQNDELKSFAREVRETKKRALDLRPAFQAFMPFWFADIDRHFKSKGSGTWPKLSDAYASWKAQSSGAPMMRLSDALYDSLTSRTSNTILEITPRTIRFGSRLPYFQYHMDGTNKMPARPPLDMSEAGFATLNALVISHITGAGARGPGNARRRR